VVGPSKLQRIDWIDALRGFAIIGVVCGHLFGMANGARGVQLFFMASAIALLHSWQMRNDGATPFFIRRLFRIAPMFWLAIPAFFWLLPQVSNDQMIAAALFVHWATPSWQNMAVPGSWSIGCEIVFYMAFPFLAEHINSFKKSILALIVSIIAAAAMWPLLLVYGAYMGLATTGAQHGFAFYFPSTQFPCFMIGFCVYYAAQRQWPHWQSDIAALAGFLFVAGGLVLRIGWDALYLAYCAAFGLIALALAAGRFRFLSNRIIVFIGLISYSAYFWHFFWIDWLQGAGLARNSIIFYALVPALTLALSFATYCLIERPMIRLGGKLAQVNGELRIANA
jgi:peptidoglycan/LPS O-acetylase OafA/YrhL